MSDPDMNGVRQVEPDVEAIHEAHKRLQATIKASPVWFNRCCHDNNWPHGEWCGGVLTRHIDGGDLVCDAGHRFSG